MIGRWIGTALVALVAQGAAAAEVELAGTAPLVLPAAGGVGAVTLRLVEVTDQRCPSRVSCVWEGLKRAKIEVEAEGADAVTLVLCNHCEDGAREGQAAGRTFTLIDLDPPVSRIEALSRTPTVEDYVVRIDVTP